MDQSNLESKILPGVVGKLVAPFLLALVIAVSAIAQNVPQPKEGEVVLRNFRFRSGEVLPELRLHYTTLGTPVRDAKGNVQNAILILHGNRPANRRTAHSGVRAVLLVPPFTFANPQQTSSLGHAKSDRSVEGAGESGRNLLRKNPENFLRLDAPAK